MTNISIFKSAGRLITGQDSLNSLESILLKLNARNPLIITDQGVMKSGTIKKVTDIILLQYSVYDQVNPEPETQQVQKCIDIFHQDKNDIIIAVGGGSVIDVAKCTAALADKSGSVFDYIGIEKINSRNIPLIVIPTTSGTGSEVTNAAVLTDTQTQTKLALMSEVLLPDVAIVSPTMSISCPASVTAASGVDALVHAMEAYIAINRSDITDGLALKAIELISEYLPTAYNEPTDLIAREKMATASLIAGLAFGNAGVGAVHALAYPVGGKYKVSHGVSNALMLPFVMKWNAVGSEVRFTDIAKAMKLDTTDNHSKNVELVLDYLHKLCEKLNMPKGLKSLNIPKNEIKKFAEEVIQVERLLKNNPRVLTISDIEAIYHEAY